MKKCCYKVSGHTTCTWTQLLKMKSLIQNPLKSAEAGCKTTACFECVQWWCAEYFSWHGKHLEVGKVKGGNLFHFIFPLPKVFCKTLKDLFYKVFLEVTGEKKILQSSLLLRIKGIKLIYLKIIMFYGSYTLFCMVSHRVLMLSSSHS